MFYKSINIPFVWKCVDLFRGLAEFNSIKKYSDRVLYISFSELFHGNQMNTPDNEVSFFECNNYHYRLLLCVLAMYCMLFLWLKWKEKYNHIVYIKTLLPFTTFTAIYLCNSLLLFTKISKCYTGIPSTRLHMLFILWSKQYINIKHANLEAAF